jgi:hypothetical protein
MPAHAARERPIGFASSPAFTVHERSLRRNMAERRIAVTIAQAPMHVIDTLEDIDTRDLSEITRTLLDLVVEHPSLCDLVGPSAAAEMDAERVFDEATIRHLAWLELTPESELALLPPLEESRKIVSPSLELIGALEQWQEELRRGVGGQRLETPSTWKHDALYMAACLEISALEAERAGDRRLARELVEKAARVLAGEVEERRERMRSV